MSPRRVARVALAVFVTLVVLEVGLRIAGALYLRRVYAGSRPAPGELVVLCLGESSTAGLWVTPQESYPARLEAMLKEAYGRPIRFVVPPHLGQNTSQMANRIDSYLDLYHPRLVIVMAGANDTWSLAESHIGRYLHVSTWEAARVRALVSLNDVRVFKLARYAALRALAPADDYLRQNPALVWGHPELVRYPPPAATYAFARAHAAAFVELWRDDVGGIVRASKASGARVLLMTYPIAPEHLPPAVVAALAREQGTAIARSDVAFRALADEGRLAPYLFADDHWHPTAAGYAVVAWTAFRAIVAADLLGLGRPLVEVAEPPAPAPAYVALPPDGRIALGSSAGAVYLGDGWARPESARRWTAASRATVLFAAKPGQELTLRLRAQPLVKPGRLEAQRAVIGLNGVTVGTLTFTGPEEQEGAIGLPAVHVRDANTLTLELPDACSPTSLGLGADGRMLALAVGGIALVAPPPPASSGTSK